MESKYIFVIILLMIAFFYFLSDQKNTELPLKIDTCDTMSSEKLKIVCYAMFLKNHTYCKLSADFAPYCYDFVFPLIDVDKTLCENLDDEDAKLSCYVELAVKEKNASICESLQNQIPIDICYTRLFDYVDVINDISLCEKIPHQSTKFACMTKLTGDINFCSNITIEVFEKGFCTAMITNNVTDCFTGRDSGGALSKIIFSSCIRNVALQTKNMSMCDIIGREEDKWKCRIAFSKNIDVCSQTADPWKDFCKLEYIKNNIY